MADAKVKKLIPIAIPNSNLWRAGFENGGELPKDMVNQRWTSRTIAQKWCDTMNTLRIETEEPVDLLPEEEPKEKKAATKKGK